MKTKSYTYEVIHRSANGTVRASPLTHDTPRAALIAAATSESAIGIRTLGRADADDVSARLIQAVCAATNLAEHLRVERLGKVHPAKLHLHRRAAFRAVLKQIRAYGDSMSGKSSVFYDGR